MANKPLRSYLAAALGILCLTAINAHAQRQMEKLGRGVVALHSATSQAYIGWRLLATEPTEVGFNLYRSTSGGAGVKLNSLPLTNTTDYLDTTANLAVSNAWYVTPVTNGVEGLPGAAYGLAGNSPVRQYLSWPLRTITGPGAPFDVKFCWVGDFDGDGEYDYLVDRISTTVATNEFLQAYKRDGTFLWQMDLGYNSTNQYNIEPGASAISIGHGDNVSVYDLDGDGKAEVCVRTARGVTFGDGAVATGPDDTTQYLSIVNGLTGHEMTRAIITNSWPADGPMSGHFGVMYCDGVRPSLLIHNENRNSSGGFQRQAMTYDYRDGQLTRRWFFTPPPNSNLSWGHQIRIMDVNHDGIDDLIDVGSVRNGVNGQTFFDTELVHGDRFHITDIDPDRPGLEMFSIQQLNPTLLATALIDMGSGSIIKKWYSPVITDVGRGTVLDLDPSHRGLEFYSTQPGIFDCKGDQIFSNNIWPPEAIWWDADLSRELEDGAGNGALNPVINKFNPASGGTSRLYSIYNEGVHQAYGGRAAFWGDILGDWREEAVLVANDYSELRVYTTKIPATNRLYCLMQNPAYRDQATCKGYYQASYVDYFLANDMPPPPTPLVSDAKLVWRGDGTNVWDAATTANWRTNWFYVGNANTNPAPFNAGDTVLFDLTGSNQAAITLVGSLMPGDVRIHAPKNFTFDSKIGSLDGATKLTKGGAGKVTLNGTNNFTGKTIISEGSFIVNGALPNSPITVRGGVWLDGRLGGTGVVGSAVSLHEGAGVSPGQGTNSPGTLTIANNVTMNGRTLNDFDLSEDASGTTKTNDLLVIAGNLAATGTNTLVIRKLDATLPPGGVYPLIIYSGTFSGGLNNFTVSGLTGIPFALTNPPGQIALVIKSYRAPATLTWTGGSGGNTWDLLTSSNWFNGAAKDQFAPNDTVRFDNTGASNLTVTLAGDLVCSNLVVDSTTNYTLTGSGGIIGAGGLTKTNSGTLVISALNNAFTGKTILSGGTLVVSELDAVGFPSPLGNPPAGSTNLVLSGSPTLRVTSESYTDRGMTLGAGTNTIDVPNSTDQLTVAGVIGGGGALQKMGAGTLAVSANNTFTGPTYLYGGNLSLGGGTANQYGLGAGPGGNGNTTVTISNATLTMFSDSGSYDSCYWNLLVPTNATATIYADDRVNLYGSLTGGGTLNFNVYYVRTELDGNWSAFTGQLNLGTDSGGGDFRIGNTSGYASASVNLADHISAYHIGGSAVAFGALSGGPLSYLSGAAWTVGSKNTDATFAGTIAGNSITKVGTGSWTITGTNSYTGTTTVSAGTLFVNGDNHSAGGAVSVGASGTLGGKGVIGGATTVNGKLAPGSNGLGTLTFNNNLTLVGGSTTFIEINKGSGAKDLVNAGGTLLFGGTLQVTNLSGVLTNGDSFQIFSAAVHGGTFAVLNLPTLATNLSWDTNAIYSSGLLAVSGAVISNPPPTNSTLVWKGDGAGNVWDTAGAANWFDPSNNIVGFNAGNEANFTDAGSNNVPVILSGALQPSALIVSATKNFTFGGSGWIAGTNAFMKSGAGTLTFANTVNNTFTGGTVISNGIVALGTDSGKNQKDLALGTGPVLIAGGGQLRLGGDSGNTQVQHFITNTITLDGGTLFGVDGDQHFTNSTFTVAAGGGTLLGRWLNKDILIESKLTGSGALTVNYGGGASSPGALVYFSNPLNTYSGTVTVRTNAIALSNPYALSNAVVNVAGTGTSANLTWSGITTIVLGGLSGAGGLSLGANQLVLGNNGGSTIYSGALSGTGSLVKNGGGTSTLAGTNSYTGATTVSNGTLLVHGRLGSTTLTAWGGTLGGNGSLAGPVNIRSGATLAPGASIGTLTVSNTVTLYAGSTTLLEIGKSPTTNDLLKTTGLLTFAGNLIVTNTSGNALATGDSFKIFDTASQTGSYNSLTLPALSAGLGWNTAALYTGGTVAVARTIPVGAWGQNDFAQATLVAGLSNTVAIAAGGYHNLALLANGAVIAWGNNSNGQCNVPPDLTNVVAIAAGGSHSIAARPDGTVAAWGGNDAGQISVPSEATNVVALAGGESHSLALRGDGSVVAWGDDTWGQLDFPGDATNLVAIAAGAHHSLALRADGIVIAWGDNLGPFGDYAGQATVPFGLNQVAAIAAGGFHSLAVNADGTVTGWGDNSLGQLSVPGGLTNIVAVGGGYAHSLALGGSGLMTAWGDNLYGQLVVDPTFTGVAAVAAGGYHSVALQGVFPAAPQLSQAEHSGGAFRVGTPTTRGKPSILFYKNFLGDPNWGFVRAVAGDGAQKTLTDPGAAADQRWYRVRIP